MHGEWHFNHFRSPDNVLDGAHATLASPKILANECLLQHLGPVAHGVQSQVTVRGGSMAFRGTQGTGACWGTPRSL